MNLRKWFPRLASFAMAIATQVVEMLDARGHSDPWGLPAWTQSHDPAGTTHEAEEAIDRRVREDSTAAFTPGSGPPRPNAGGVITAPWFVGPRRHFGPGPAVIIGRANGI
jgi:hypothetical protein